MSIYDFKLIDGQGKEVALSEYKGKVMLIVNTATGCGFTPHYEPIEQMYSDLHEKGLEVIDIPCNQFKEQAPGTDEEIAEFCKLNYGTEFPQMKKSDVNGANELPLYTYLKEQQGFEGFSGPMADTMNGLLKTIDSDFENNSNIKWNFTKFIVNREGEVVKRFEPTADMNEVRSFIENLL
ncbi:MAG: glutathione peroxidase [Eubacteriales bacterium]|nr:glutathione peroxidase [Eubacteriales bacterium]MDY3332883.1 glutathione peroxidase [Gallibacter sp.]